MGCLGTHWYFSFSASQAARGGSRLAAGAFPVSRMVLELPLPFHPTRQKALHMGQVSFFYLFPFNTLVVRDTIGFEPIRTLALCKIFFIKTSESNVWYKNQCCVNLQRLLCNVIGKYKFSLIWFNCKHLKNKHPIEFLICIGERGGDSCFNNITSME